MAFRTYRLTLPLLLLALIAGILGMTGCGSINITPALSGTAKLTPNPPVIIVAPFNTQTAKWLVGQNQWFDREGYNFKVFKEDFQAKFQRILIERLMKLAPARRKWVGALPNEGWMVGGDFLTIYQGSRALRSAIGFGAGETKLQTRVYVYDLSKSKTEFVMSFYTGIRESKQGSGSGSGRMPGLVVGDVYNAATSLGAGLTLDSTRTAREIRKVLAKYL